MKEKLYTLWLSALALLVFTGGAKAETVEHTLYFGQKGGTWSLYTDRGLTSAYTGNEGKWQASENTLTLNGFEFTTSATTSLRFPANCTLVLAENSINRITTTGAQAWPSMGICFDDETGDTSTISGKGYLEVTVADNPNASTYAIYAYGNLSIEGATLIAKAGNAATDELESFGVYTADGAAVIQDGARVETSAGPITGDSKGLKAVSLSVADDCILRAQGKTEAVFISPTPPMFTNIYASVNYDGREATTENITLADNTYKVGADVAKYVQINMNIVDGLKPNLKNYIVDSQEGLAELADIVNGTGEYTGNANALLGYTLLLTKDIELQDGIAGMDATKGWTPIGTKPINPFNGTFDGNGHTISGLWINDENANAGFFGCIEDATVKNLGLELAAVGIRGGLVGGLASLCSHSTVNNCYVSGTVEATSDLGALLIANVNNSSTISNCYVEGSIKGGSESQIGGLIAILYDSQLSNCYAACEIDAQQVCGGLIGRLGGDGSAKNNIVISSSIVGGETQTRRIVGDSSGGSLSNNYAWVENIKDPIFNTDGINWTGEMTDQPIKDWNEEGKDPIWLIDETGETMPKLAVFGDNQPTVLNPKKQQETPGTATTYTINLEVADGIDMYNLASGNHTVSEGDHLYLQFLPEDRTLGAADILFLIDGIETEFKILGDGSYFSYILNPVEADHTILIALKEYTVTLPEVEGVTYNVGAGIHQVGYGETFTFNLTLADDIDPEKVHVYANGIEIQPDALRSVVWSYTIDKVIRSIVVEIEGANTTSNVELAHGVRVVVENGKLKVESEGQAVDVAVYTITGQTFAQLRALRGSKTLTLPAGVYLVRSGNQMFKVMVND